MAKNNIKTKTEVEKKPTTPAEGPMPEPPKGMFREIGEILFYGLALLIFFKGYVWQNFQIPTASMENTLLIGDHITANTFVFKPAYDWEKKILPFRDVKRGDVVVFKFPGRPQEDWIKRCIGVPGDIYQLVDDQVLINDKPLEHEDQYAFFKKSKGERCEDLKNRPCDYYEIKPGIENAQYRTFTDKSLSYLLGETRRKVERYRRLDEKAYQAVVARLDAVTLGEDAKIPEGFYLMMGDNRNNSHDSRAWGLVPRELIEGRAYFLWWSYGEEENAHEKTGWDLIWTYLRVPVRIFTHTHWDTTFTRIK